MTIWEQVNHTTEKLQTQANTSVFIAHTGNRVELAVTITTLCSKENWKMGEKMQKNDEIWQKSANEQNV